MHASPQVHGLRRRRRGGAGADRGGGGGQRTGSPGTANTGGGGGGGGHGTGPYATDYGQGGNAGSGIVIIQVPTADYSGVVTGSPTVTTSGTDTILKFTGTGTVKG